MEKLLDQKCFHFVEEDTDSLYFAFDGNKCEEINKSFKIFITNELFTNEKVY
jgi:DNA polymerase elongation subunit (family B)